MILKILMYSMLFTIIDKKLSKKVEKISTFLVEDFWENKENKTSKERGNQFLMIYVSREKWNWFNRSLVWMVQVQIFCNKVQYKLRERIAKQKISFIRTVSYLSSIEADDKWEKPYCCSSLQYKITNFK